MPRKPSFRRDTQLQNEVRRVNKLVQNKQSRIRVNKGLEVSGVDTVKYTELNSRKEINAYLKEMNSFLDKKSDFRVKNEKGAELQYSEVQQVERTINRANRLKLEQWNRVKDKPFTYKGEDTGLTVEQVADPVLGIGDPLYSDFKPIKFNPSRFRSEKEFRDWAKEKGDIYNDKNWLKKRNELYRDNYIKSLENNLGNASQGLQDHIKIMSLDDFIDRYYTEKNAHIKFVYDKLSIQARVQELERIWGV